MSLKKKILSEELNIDVSQYEDWLRHSNRALKEANHKRRRYKRKDAAKFNKDTLE